MTRNGKENESLFDHFQEACPPGEPVEPVEDCKKEERTLYLVIRGESRPRAPVAPHGVCARIIGKKDSRRRRRGLRCECRLWWRWDKQEDFRCHDCDPPPMRGELVEKWLLPGPPITGGLPPCPNKKHRKHWLPSERDLTIVICQICHPPIEKLQETQNG